MTAVRYRLALVSVLTIMIVGWSRLGLAQDSWEAGFQQHVKPFLKQHCERCHHGEKQTSGIRVDQLSAALEDRHLKLWEVIRQQVAKNAMPPEDEPQPNALERQRFDEWVQAGLKIARSRPVPKNGSARRLTVAQYRNTLRELLQLDDDLADLLPPDAVSKDGFVNNQETLAMSPLLIEAYFDVADKALSRTIVDVAQKPKVQNFRVDLGARINADPCKDNLILGADSLLLNNADFVVTQLTPTKSFAYESFLMQTKFRFIEGYRGNDTVRGWRDFDSVYHAVFACMRGAHGYPKGRAYSTVPEGLLLRPAIPSAELFGVESTYGPRANFKISLRELPDDGRFRVTVMASKYDDGLLLDPAIKPVAESTESIVSSSPTKPDSIVKIPQAGIYQVDVHLGHPDQKPVAPEATKLNESLIGAWSFDGSPNGSKLVKGADQQKVDAPDAKSLAGQFLGDAKLVESPFGQALSLDGNGDSVVVKQHQSLHVGAGEFTVSAWIRPKQLRQAGIVCLGKYSWTHGWYLDMPGNNGVLRIESARPDNQSNGTVQSAPGALRVNEWQHVAAVVKRAGQGETQLFINGYQVAKGTIGAENLDNPKVDLHIGRIQDAQQFVGEIDEVHMHRRALTVAEIQALVEPGRKFVSPPPREKPQELTLNLGSQQFISTLHRPAFLAVRLPAGDLSIGAHYLGATPIDRLVFTRLKDDAELARQFSTFEKRSPSVGVHVGLRRDCGSTLSQVGAPQRVSSTDLTRFLFEGAIRNFPSPDVEKANVNYLAGIREIGVRSEFTDGRDMPRLLIRSVEFEGPLYDDWPPAPHRQIFGNYSDQQAAITNPQRQQGTLQQQPDATNEPRFAATPEHARHILRRFATRAFRRPVTKLEEQHHFAVFEKSLAAGTSFEHSIKDALQVILTSPQFLFLIENSSTPAADPLDDHELASKLSYFLWNGPPDRTTLEHAAQGSLRQHLNAEVTRLVNDVRFERFANEFTTQWLALDKFAVLEPDRGKFPKLTRDTRTQLKQEPIEFWKYLIRQNLPVRNLMASDFVIANEVSANYYDLADRTESGFDFLPIAHGRQELGGILTQAAILSGLSDGREANPVKRGAWLARRIVAEPPDDPPPNVPMLKEDRSLPLRARLEQHRNQPGCAQCHSKIDPWGVPFQEFDAGGRFHPEGNDARSTLPDKTEVKNFDDLRRYLADDRLDQVAFSVLKHLTTYAIGRNLTFNELEFLKRDGLKLKANGYRMQDMVRYVVGSPMFLEK